MIAAFPGATLDDRTGRIWFHPLAEGPTREIRFRSDPDNAWFRCQCAVYATGRGWWVRPWG